MSEYYGEEYFGKYYKKFYWLSKQKIQYNLDKKYLLKNYIDSRHKKILDFGCVMRVLKRFKSQKFDMSLTKVLRKRFNQLFRI